MYLTAAHFDTSTDQFSRVRFELFNVQRLLSVRTSKLIRSTSLTSPVCRPIGRCRLSSLFGSSRESSCIEARRQRSTLNGQASAVTPTIHNGKHTHLLQFRSFNLVKRWPRHGLPKLRVSMKKKYHHQSSYTLVCNQCLPYQGTCKI